MSDDGQAPLTENGKVIQGMMRGLIAGVLGHQPGSPEGDAAVDALVRELEEYKRHHPLHDLDDVAHEFGVDLNDGEEE